MKTNFDCYRNAPSIRPLRAVAWMLVLLCSGLFTRPLLASDGIKGFTEPNCTVNVATSETGIVRKVHVREGDVVRAGQILASLDDDLHVASLAILSEQRNAKGRLESAKAELRIRQSRLETLKSLHKAGNARREEVNRAQADVEISRAQLSAAEEELAVRELEYQRAQLQLRRRTVSSPLDGIIAKQHKQAGELVTTHEAQLFEIVQLDPLLAVFPVRSSDSCRLRTGLAVTVGLAGSDLVPGTVEFVAPVTDGESGTVKVTVRIPNPLGKHRSGERCVLHLPATASLDRPGSLSTGPSDEPLLVGPQ